MNVSRSLNLFADLRTIATSFFAACDDVADSVRVYAGWDDYNDETYEKQTFEVDFISAGKPANEDKLDCIPAARKLERTAPGLMEKLYEALGLETDGYAEPGQETLEILFTKTGETVTVSSLDWNGTDFSGPFADVVAELKNR